jgi:hypothetical protein
MHSSRPDWVLGDARLTSSTMTTLAKIGPGAELEAVLALVVDVRADDVGGQQVGGALDARELEVHRARERAGERRLADAGQVLDEDVALGEERDSACSSTSSRPRRRADVPGDAPATAATPATSPRPTRRRGGCRCSAGHSPRAQAATTRRGSRGDVRLGARGHRGLAVGGDDRHLVGGASKPMSGARCR